MKKKILWLDTETTGTDPALHEIVQLAALVEEGGKVVAECDLRFRPTGTPDPEALRVTGRTVEELQRFPPSASTFRELTTFLGTFVNRYDKTDKFFLAGYNIQFDISFLRQLFIRHGDKYFGSWFFWPALDVQGTVVEESEMLLPLPNFKLGTVAGALGVELDAHDALNDIRATREVWRRLKGVETGPEISSPPPQLSP